MLVGAALGSLLSGRVTDILGRKKVMRGYFHIPETKGHSLEQVEEHWMKGGRPREL